MLLGLEIGTEYWLSVRTSYLELEGEESEVFAFSSTYGNGRQLYSAYICLSVSQVASSPSLPSLPVSHIQLHEAGM